MTAHASGETVLVTISILATITTLAVVCRLYTRIYLVRNGGIDDWLIVAALLFTIGMTAGIGMQVRYGLGQSSSLQTPEEARLYRKSFWFAIWLYHLGIGLARLSVVFQCMRIFPQAAWSNGRWIMRFMLFVNGTFIIWAVFSNVFTCFPIHYFWDAEVPNGKCMSKRALWLVNSSVAMVLDFAVAILPLPWIKQLHLPLRQKVYLVGLFVLAGLPCILALIRLQALIEVATAVDAAYDNAILAIFSANEVYVSIVCASLPSLKAWYNRIIKPRLRSSTRRLCRHWWPTSESSSNSGGLSLKPGGVMCWLKLRVPARQGRRNTARSGILGNQWDSTIELMDRPPVNLGGAIHVVREIEQEVELQRPERVAVKHKPGSGVQEEETEHVEDPRIRCGVLPSLDEDMALSKSSRYDSHNP